MKAAGPLPEPLVPYAERLFAWFPEVMVSLGVANLPHLFELPPASGAHVKIEETGDYKLLYVRLPRRRAGGPRETEPTAAGHEAQRESSLSPFSRSRQLVGAKPGGSGGRGCAAASAQARPALESAPPVLQAPRRAARPATGPAPDEEAPCSPGSPEAKRMLAAKRRLHYQRACEAPPAAVEPRPLLERSYRPPPQELGPRCDPAARSGPPPERSLRQSFPPAQQAEGRPGARSRGHLLGEFLSEEVPRAWSDMAAEGAVADEPDPRHAQAGAPQGEARRPTASAASRPREKQEAMAGSSCLERHDPGSPRLSSPGSHCQWSRQGDAGEDRQAPSEGKPPEAAPQRKLLETVPEAIAGSSGLDCHEPSSPRLSSSGSQDQWSRQGDAGEDRQAPSEGKPPEAAPQRKLLETVPEDVVHAEAKPEDTAEQQPEVWRRPLAAASAQAPELAASPEVPPQPLEAPASSEAEAAQQGAPPPPREPAFPAAEYRHEAPEECRHGVPTCAEESDEDTNSDEEYLTYTTSVGEGVRNAFGMERDDGMASAPVGSFARPSLVLGGLNKSLLKRRGLELGLSDDWRRSRLEENSTRPEGPKILQPAVLPTMSSISSSTRLRLGQQPMPGAFPHHRAVIFMDWDDTLCPTTWIRNLLKEHLSEQWEWAEGEFGFDDFDWKDRIPAWFNQPLPDLPHFQESIAELQLAVIELIKVAQTYGVVCIVTNAVDGWVLKTCKKWLPKLKQYINGHGAIPPIAVLYGQQEYLHRKPHPASPAATLPFVDSQGELMLWKLEAFAKALEHTAELYRTAELYSPTGHGRFKGGRLFGMPRSPKKTRRASSGAKLECVHQLGGSQTVTWVADRGEKDVVSVVSIGDSEAEMQAGQLAVLALSSARRWSRRRARAQSCPPDRQPGHPWIKNVKLEERPTVEQMIDKLRRLRDALPGIVAARSHMRLEPRDIGADLPAAASAADTRLLCEQLLTQIV